MTVNDCENSKETAKEVRTELVLELNFLSSITDTRTVIEKIIILEL